MLKGALSTNQTFKNFSNRVLNINSIVLERKNRHASYVIEEMNLIII